jgi:hypothetical protein
MGVVGGEVVASPDSQGRERLVRAPELDLGTDGSGGPGLIVGSQPAGSRPLLGAFRVQSLGVRDRSMGGGDCVSGPRFSRRLLIRGVKQVSELSARRIRPSVPQRFAGRLVGSQDPEQLLRGHAGRVRHEFL